MGATNSSPAVDHSTLAASSSSSSSGPLLPDYTLLSHCIQYTLARSSASSCTATSFHSHVLLPRDVTGLVASFLWSPCCTSTANSLHTRTDWLIGDPTLPHCTGDVHHDTRQVDQYSSELHSRILRGWRIRTLHGWGAEFANGLGVTYGPPTADSADTFDVEAVYGSHHQPQPSHFELQAGERIVQVTFASSTWFQGVRFHTSLGRQYQVGRAESHRVDIDWRPLLPAADKLRGRQVEVLAFMLGVGGHIHNMGVWYQLLSPATTERAYGSAEMLAAVLRRPGVVSNAAAAEQAYGTEPEEVREARPAFFWARGRRGRMGGHVLAQQQHEQAAVGQDY